MSQFESAMPHAAPQGLWAPKSRQFQLSESLRMLSFVDHHFQGRYREQIDEHRLGVITYLLGQIEHLQRQLPPDHDPLLVINVPPPQARRSPASKLVRAVMRPVEEAVRKWRAA